jgi:hypothetical protein
MEKSCKTNEKTRSFRELIRSWSFWKNILFVAIGGVAGYLFYYFIGCSSGSCAITGNPYMSMIAGGLLGYLATNSPCRTC